jgi:DNA polymerase
MTSLDKDAVADALARKPEDFVRQLLELRQRGAYTTVQKFKKLLAYADPDDRRIRGALRYHGAGPGRWTSVGAQLQNLKRNDAELPASLVDAVLAGNRAELARYGNPIEVIAGLARAALCACEGHELICADLNAIESRIIAWIAGEKWKLKVFEDYDKSGDKDHEPYRIMAHTMLHKNSPVSEISAAERQLGKCGELACGLAVRSERGAELPRTKIFVPTPRCWLWSKSGAARTRRSASSGGR